MNEAVETLLAEDVTILVKGSRVMGLDQLVGLLKSDDIFAEVPSC